MIAALRGRRLFPRRRPPPRPARPSRVGTPAPTLAGVSPAGTPIQVDTGPGTRVVVTFLTSSCVTCQVFWTGMDAEASPGGDADIGPSMVVITPDPTLEDRGEVARRARVGTPVVMSSAGWINYGVTGSPYFVVVIDGVIRAEGTASTWAEMLELIPID